MFVTIRRALGALPPVPSNVDTRHGGLLVPFHEWVRYYEVDKQHQLKQCPKNPPFGCYMIGGYAWGQRENYPNDYEFTPRDFKLKPLPAPFPHPQVAAKPKPAPKPAKIAPKPKPAPKTPAQAYKTNPPTPAPVISKSSPAVVIAAPAPAVVSNTPVIQNDQTQPKVSHRLLGGVGAVVGVGLFVAMGLTLLRKPR